MKPEHFSSHAVAKLIHVSPSTVLAWVDKGILPAYRTIGGHRRIERTQLIKFLKLHEMPVPESLLMVKRLLAIDDEPIFLRTLKRTLNEKAPKLKVETAVGAMEALLKVGTFGPNAVLIDAYMPGIDGIELCERLRADTDTAHILVIAITGDPSPSLADKFKKAGALACLVKPLPHGRLLSLLGLGPRH